MHLFTLKLHSDILSTTDSGDLDFMMQSPCNFLQQYRKRETRFQSDRSERRVHTLTDSYDHRDHNYTTIVNMTEPTADWKKRAHLSFAWFI